MGQGAMAPPPFTLTFQLQGATVGFLAAFQTDTVQQWMQPSQGDFGKGSSSYNWGCGLSRNDAALPLQNCFLRPCGRVWGGGGGGGIFSPQQQHAEVQPAGTAGWSMDIDLEHRQGFQACALPEDALSAQEKTRSP